MPMGDRRAAKLIGLVQAKVHEPVLSAAILAPKGKYGAMVGLGLVGTAVHNTTQQSALGFRPYNAFAVTEHGIHVFEAGVNAGMRVKGPVGAWPWGAFGASTSNGAMTKFLFLSWPNGSLTQLEAQVRGVQKFQAAVIDEIVARAAASGAPPPAPVY
jgi:hypothetical protein